MGRRASHGSAATNAPTNVTNAVTGLPSTECVVVRDVLFVAMVMAV